MANHRSISVTDPLVPSDTEADEATILVGTADPSGQDTVAALQKAIEHARHFLPAQGPIGVFIHHNTLHAFQHLPFHKALEEAGALYGAQTYFSEPRFRSQYAAGRISDEDVESGLRELPSDADKELLRKTLCFPLWEEPVRVEASDAWNAFLPAVSGPTRKRMAEETWTWLSRHIATVGNTTTLTDLAEAIAGPSIRDEVNRTAQSQSKPRLSRRNVGPGGVDAEAYRKLLASHAERLKVSVFALWDAEAAVAGGFLCDLFGAPLHLRHFERTLSSAPERIAARVLHRASGAFPAPAEDRGIPPSNASATELADSFLIRWSSAFLDQGVASWPWPQRERGLYGAVSAHVLDAHAPLPSWLEPIRELLARFKNPEALVLHLLPKMPPQDLEHYVTERLLVLPGWAGMISRLESSGEISTPAPKLMDFLALRLCLDNLAEDHSEDSDACAPEPSRPNPGAQWRLFVLAQAMGWAAPTLLKMAAADVAQWQQRLLGTPPRLRQRLWQEAYEAHYRQKVLSGVAHNVHRPLSERQPARPWVQVAFCIDDREEAIRRHFEEADPTLETLAIAGFFGVAMAYRGLDDAQSADLCPVVVTPTHEVHERPVDPQRPLLQKRHARRRFGTLISHQVEHALRGSFLASVLVFLRGALAAVALPLSVLFPRWFARTEAALKRLVLPSPQTTLSAERLIVQTDVASGGDGRKGLLQGFTIDEMADRVSASLKNMGVAHRLSPLVVLLGHGASTSNNPHQSAYDCGACGGRHGGANARLFALMANHPTVRARLAQRGIQIPDETYFLGGLHNTTTDEIQLFDAHRAPEKVRLQIAHFERAADIACARSAHERCRRFESAPRRATPHQALNHVRSRAVDISQARPELGHVTNAACVVGRRSLTRGLFLDRRAFMVSYDPFTDDPQGSILERLLVAVGPVGAGINLEYYFSCVDNARLGAGTKLPHNLSAMLGVMDGASSDLRTGLPSQMIEIHEPMRLLILAESTPDVLTAICQRQPGVAELVVNQWVQLVSVDPTTAAMHRFTSRGWEACDLPQEAPPTAKRSGEYYAGHKDFLPPALLSSPRPHVA